MGHFWQKNAKNASYKWSTPKPRICLLSRLKWPFWTSKMVKKSVKKCSFLPHFGQRGSGAGQPHSKLIVILAILGLKNPIFRVQILTPF